MENSFYNMELAQFRELFAQGRLTGLGEDLCIIDVRNEDMAPRLQTPVRLDAYLAVFCISGSTTVDCEVIFLGIISNIFRNKI